MTADVELLPLPEKSEIDRHLPTGVRVYGYTADDMKTYARANVAHATAPLQAEIEALRAGAGETKEVAVRAMRQRDAQYNRAERLAEALAGLITWFPSADTYRRLGFDPATPMQVLKEAHAALGMED